MRLGSASEGDVLRNSRNGSFYRYAREERGRARIRPLEHFPNGRLIPKPTDTLVDPGLQVALVGRWSEGMAVEGPPVRARARYEEELRDQAARLAVLEAEYEALPPNGVGRQSRGSQANKVKNCRMRIEVLRAGLEELVEVDARPVPAEARARQTRARDVVLLPSGLPALVLSTRVVGGRRQAVLRTRLPGGQVTAALPVDVLRPWADRQLCSL